MASSLGAGCPLARCHHAAWSIRWEAAPALLQRSQGTVPVRIPCGGAHDAMRDSAMDGSLDSCGDGTCGQCSCGLHDAELKGLCHCAPQLILVHAVPCEREPDVRAPPGEALIALAHGFRV